MLITLERFAFVLVEVTALYALDFIRCAQIGPAFREIRKQDLASLALRTSEENVPFSGNQSSHEEYLRTVKSTDFIAQIDVSLNTFLV